jgi:hypothetical protein
LVKIPGNNCCLVVWIIFHFLWYMGCHPSYWLSYFSRWLKHVKTTNQIAFSTPPLGHEHLILA